MENFRRTVHQHSIWYWRAEEGVRSSEKDTKSQGGAKVEVANSIQMPRLEV